jgi:hypothetical protein
MRRLLFAVGAPATLLLAAGVWSAAIGQVADRDSRNDRAANVYRVTASSEQFVLVDSRSGRTWMLARPAAKESVPVWLPIERIDDSAEAEVWRATDHARSQQHTSARHAQGHSDPLDSAVSETDSPRVDNLFKTLAQQELFKMQMKRDLLRRSYGGDHPEVVAVQSAIDALEQRIERESSDEALAPESPSPFESLGAVVRENLALAERLLKELQAHGQGDSEPARTFEQQIRLLRSAAEELDDRHD